MKYSNLFSGSFSAGLIALSIAIGTRAQGAYVCLFVLSIIGFISVLRGSTSTVYGPILARVKPPAVLLAAYIASLLFSGFLKGGAAGLKESVSLYSAIPFLFIAGILIPSVSSITRFRCYRYVAMPLAISLILSGLGYAISNLHHPISSLRPSEFVLVIGVAALSLVAKDFIGIIAQNYSFNYNFSLAESLFLSGLFGALFIGAFSVFRGVISSAILIGALFLLLLNLAKSRTYIFMIVAVLAGGAFLAVLLSPLVRFAVLKIIVSSFSSGEGFSSRFHLFGQGMALVSANLDGISLFGPVGPSAADFWAHNTFLDLFIHDGMVPAILFTAFVFDYAIVMLRECRTVEALINFCLLPAILLMGSLLQPVQYSDGISYSISYACLGYSLGLALRSHRFHLSGAKY